MKSKIPTDTIQRARAADLSVIAERYTELKRNNDRSYYGVCPGCGDHDNFQVYRTGDRWAYRCYDCHQDPQDVISFIQWREGCDFKRAIEIALDESFVVARPKAQPRPRPSTPAQPSWQPERMAVALAVMQSALYDDVGEPARDYLLGRGLTTEAWAAFGLGFNPLTSVPGTKGKTKAAAVAIPWYVRGELRAIRYRFLKKTSGGKLASAYGSSFTGILFGGHVFDGWLPALRTLILCEGEINAMSIWRVVQGTGCDVLSIGSDSTRLTEAMIRDRKSVV